MSYIRHLFLVPVGGLLEIIRRRFLVPCRCYSGGVLFPKMSHFPRQREPVSGRTLTGGFEPTLGEPRLPRRIRNGWPEGWISHSDQMMHSQCLQIRLLRIRQVQALLGTFPQKGGDLRVVQVVMLFDHGRFLGAHLHRTGVGLLKGGQGAG